MKLFETDTTCNTYTLALCLKVVAPTLQQLCIFLSLVVKFGALETQKSLYAQVIPSRSSTCLQPHIVDIRPQTWLCEWTQFSTAVRIGSWHTSALKCQHYLAAVQYGLARSFSSGISAQHPVHFCCEELLLSRTKVVPLHVRVTNTDICTRKCLCAAVNLPPSAYFLYWHYSPLWNSAPSAVALRRSRSCYFRIQFLTQIILRSSTEPYNLVADMPTCLCPLFCGILFSCKGLAPEFNL